MENDPKKILLIDDSALMRRVMSDIINHIDGFTVAYLAADGEEGYAYLSKQNDIDVVMTDIDMPKMDGLTLIKKSKEAGVVVPFIVFSAREDSYAVFTALDLGAIEFIRKPEHIFQKDVQRYAEKIKKALCMAVEVKERTLHKAEAACTMEPEKADEKQKADVVFLCRVPTTVAVNQITDGLKRVKADAKRHDQPQ